MCKNIIFLFNSKTLEGYKIIGAGICDIKYKEDVLKEFEKIKKTSLDIKDLNNSYEIDYLLDKKIKAIAPKYVIGLGLSIYIPNAKGPTGAIIGNPHNMGESANGRAEEIGEGFSLIALAGGPGLLIKGSKEVAKNIFINIVLGENRLVPFKNIIKELVLNKIDIAIVITDGTGIKQNGKIWTYYFGKIKLIEMNGRG